MFQYLEAMVSNTSLSFPQELLKAMFELYIDLVSIHVADKEEQDDNNRDIFGGPNLRQIIIDSKLSDEISSGLTGLSEDDKLDINERFTLMQNQVYRERARQNQSGFAPQ